MAHFTESTRIKLEQYLNFNYSFRKISKLLNMSVSSISREVSRNRKIVKSRTEYSFACTKRSNCSLRQGQSIADLKSVTNPQYYSWNGNTFKMQYYVALSILINIK